MTRAEIVTPAAVVLDGAHGELIRLEAQPSGALAWFAPRGRDADDPFPVDETPRPVLSSRPWTRR